MEIAHNSNRNVRQEDSTNELWLDLSSSVLCVVTHHIYWWMHDASGFQWLQRLVSKRLLSDWKATFPQKLNIRCAIGPIGPVNIFVYHQNTDSKTYIQILENQLLPSIEEPVQSSNDCYLMHDNAPYSKSNEVKSFWRNIQTIPWPTYSGDLNPVEDLWAVLKLIVAEKQPRTLDELEKSIYEAWGGLSLEYFVALLQSLRTRVELLIGNDGNDGGNIDY